jgi:hypothetical protein
MGFSRNNSEGHAVQGLRVVSKSTTDLHAAFSDDAMPNALLNYAE